MKNTCIHLSGTFDPVTNGHLDIIERIRVVPEKVIVTIAVNPNKKKTVVTKRKGKTCF